jgi:hypothetical protein
MNILQFESLNLEFICKRYEINKFWNPKYKTRSNSAINQARAWGAGEGCRRALGDTADSAMGTTLAPEALEGMVHGGAAQRWRSSLRRAIAWTIGQYTGN